MNTIDRLPSTTDPGDGRALYLDLMKRSLLNMIYGDKEVIYIEPRHPVKKMIKAAAEAFNMQIIIPKQFDPAKLTELLNLAVSCKNIIKGKWLREQGANWPPELLELVYADGTRWNDEMITWARSEGYMSPNS